MAHDLEHHASPGPPTAARRTARAAAARSPCSPRTATPTCPCPSRSSCSAATRSCARSRPTSGACRATCTGSVPDNDLLGRDVGSLGASASRASFDLESAGLLRDVDPKGPVVPSFLTGEVHGFPAGARMAVGGGRAGGHGHRALRRPGHARASRRSCRPNTSSRAPTASRRSRSQARVRDAVSRRSRAARWTTGSRAVAGPTRSWTARAVDTRSAAARWAAPWRTRRRTRPTRGPRAGPAPPIPRGRPTGSRCSPAISSWAPACPPSRGRTSRSSYGRGLARAGFKMKAGVRGPSGQPVLVYAIANGRATLLNPPPGS